MRRPRGQGRAVQVDPIKPMLKVPGTSCLKLKHDKLFSSFASNFNLRRHNKDAEREKLVLDRSKPEHAMACSAKVGIHRPSFLESDIGL